VYLSDVFCLTAGPYFGILQTPTEVASFVWGNIVFSVNMLEDRLHRSVDRQLLWMTECHAHTRLKGKTRAVG